MPKVNWEILEQYEDPELKGCFEDTDPKDLIMIACQLCSCGSREDFSELFMEVLRFCDCPHTGDIGKEKFPNMPRGCYSSMQHELAAKVLDSYDLINHGTGIGWPWTTDDGKKLLALIDRLEAERRDTPTN